MNSETEQSLPIVVGVGASAGGLEAFQQFVRGLDSNHNLIVILVQHLDPDHESLMPELIAAKTDSPVHSATNGMRVEKGHIYLIPPGYEMEIDEFTLKLEKFSTPRGLRRPIDRFFDSLAKAHGENAIAVVLSGTGSDGAKGAREVKGAGGLVFVQDPKEAKYDGMPQSVLDQGGADITSKAVEIVDIIRDYFSLRVGSAPDSEDDDDFIGRIMRHVRFRTGHDFSDYKPGTILRRLSVRMSVLNLTSRADYLKYLVENKAEADLLFRDLLINVTSFFRDKNHFEGLEKMVVPDIVEKAEDGGQIRVWVAGCSTGEEAYSLAMLFAEEIERTKKLCNVIVFGTDIDEEALAAARAGKYSDAVVDAIPKALLERYFRPTNNGYEAGGRLREMVRFSRHSLIKDPPFSKVDLLSCRNVLIYFNDNLQELAVRVFHYALTEGGYLFIGPSENPRPVVDYFTEVSARERIFRRNPGTAKPLNLGSMPTVSSKVERQLNAIRSSGNAPPSDIENVLLDRYLPAHMHADHNGRVTYTSENAARFLAVRGGRVDNDLFNLIAPELETTFRRISRVSDTAGSREEREFNGKIRDRGERLIVVAERLDDGTILYVIHDQLMADGSRPGSGIATDSGPDAYVNQLEAELDSARQAVRTTVEELETSNEELKSSNEEMMSMNEELQSANEELTTINDELQEKLRELAQSKRDLETFIRTAQVAIVFLDENLKLRSYTPEALEYFNFTQADIGRPLSDLNSTVNQDRVVELCEKTIETGLEVEEEFKTKEGQIHLAAHFMPYSPDGGDKIGAVFTLQDVSELRQLVTETEEARQEATLRLAEVEQIYRASPMAMALIDRDMRYIRLNEKLAEINGEPIELHLNRTIREVIPSVADQAEATIRTVLETGKTIRGVRVTGAIRSDPNDQRVWENDYTPFYLDGKIEAVAVTVRDITDDVHTSATLRDLMSELEHRVKNMLDNVSALINQARGEAEHDGEVYTKLINRIQGLSKTHALLTSKEWASAGLSEIFKPETIDVYGEERVSLKGPNIRVSAQAALALGMAIHELATNAAKYGAFSSPDGKVELTWSRINDVDSDRLEITWKEHGGPEPRKPKRIGFGSKLIRSTVEGTLGGKTSQTWESDGLKQTIVLDFDVIAPKDSISG